jgi:hypothetical protein
MSCKDTHSDEDPLADVWNSTPPDEGHPGVGVERRTGFISQSHPSDIRRLQEEHNTAGYREGLAFAKAASVQSGFDEGFGLGASIGLEVGRILGILQGIASAVAQDEVGINTEERLREQKLIEEANVELGLRSIFAEKYWNVDGTWKYAIESSVPVKQADEPEMLFTDVAKAHPLLRKWTQKVEEHGKRWGVSEQHVKGWLEDDIQAGEGEAGDAAKTKTVLQPKREPLDW